MKKVLVLMSTYNGEKYLRIQIESILAQKDVCVSLLVRDDGSSDATTLILDEYAKEGKLTWYSGKNIRPAQSFFDLLFNAPESEYIALSDQDDFWEENKLSRAVEILEKFDSSKPLLYCSKTKPVDENLSPLNIKYKNPLITSFSQSIIASNATGCTMCLNKILWKTILLHRPLANIMHDGWIHKLCLAVGGNVFFDDKSYILYRQHGNNVVGVSSTFFKRWAKRWRHFKESAQIRSNVIVELYENYASQMPKQNQDFAEMVINYKNSLKGRIQLACNFKIKYPIKAVDFSYRLAVLLGVF